jgi:lysophosphatidate acyltransferase
MTFLETLLSYLLKLLALFFGLEFSLFAMSLFGNTTASFYGRLLMAYFTLCLCAVYGVIASLVLRLVGYQGVSQWTTARSFKWAMRLTTGVKFEVVSGQQHLKTRPAVFVGNHQTALDVLLLATIFPPWCSVTAKKQLRNMPFLGWFMALSGTIFIDRSNRATAVKAFEGAAREMRTRRQSVFIFPEGTRSNADKPTMLPFKKGAFHLAMQAGVPIVPVVCANYSGVLSMKESRFRRGTIPVVGARGPSPLTLCDDRLTLSPQSFLPFRLTTSTPRMWTSS